MGEIRIIGGQWKRSKLPVPDLPGLRPTPDRIRETLFNWLGQTLAGWRVLDAFAGSGALGFEAASRGADAVVMVEREAALVDGLRASQRRLQATAITLHRANALTWMAACQERFDLIFLDPPFADDLFDRALTGSSMSNRRGTSPRRPDSPPGARAAPGPCITSCCGARTIRRHDQAPTLASLAAPEGGASVPSGGRAALR